MLSLTEPTKIRKQAIHHISVASPACVPVRVVHVGQRSGEVRRGLVVSVSKPTRDGDHRHLVARGCGRTKAPPCSPSEGPFHNTTASRYDN